MKILKNLFIILFFVSLLFLVHNNANSQVCGSKEECEKLISETEQKLSVVRSQKNTLASQIQYMDSQIYLTTLKIQNTQQQITDTEAEIETLGGRIDGVNSSLDYLTKLLFNKIKEGYKRRDIPFFNILLDADNASTLFNQLKYARSAQENDRRVAYQLQQAKQNFEDQKDLREKKKIDLDNLQITFRSQNANLNNQKADKQRLLVQTQNDERTYQNLLAQTRAEYLAIQGIISGAGTESQVREVGKGETIAVIATFGTGLTCNSQGPHLHFTVLVGGADTNPFNYLKADISYENRSGDAWNPSGGWDWPLNPTIKFEEGWGSDTSFIRSGSSWYSSHDGLDIWSSSSYDVKSVENGTLYRGSYSGNSGCALPYTKVAHKDSNITSLYLHTYTQ